MAATQTQGLHSLGLRVKAVAYEKNETALILKMLNRLAFVANIGERFDADR